MGIKMGYSYIDEPDALAHYGILGMKWGHRPSDPNPNDSSHHPVKTTRKSDQPQVGDKLPVKVETQHIIHNSDGSYTLPKNYKFYRIGDSQLKNANGVMYVSSADSNDVYRYMKNLGPSLLGDLLETSHHYVLDISVKKPIRMASEEQHNRIVLEKLLNDPKALKQFNTSFYSMVYDVEKDVDTNILRRALENPLSTESKTISYGINSMLGDSETHKDFIDGIYNEFKERNFDAIPDIHDIYSGTSESPMIILNTDKVQVDTREYITKDIYRAGKKKVKELGKLQAWDFKS